jgi:large subunit ribosomal protein L24
MHKIKKGDTIQVIAGRDKGKRGKVLKVFPDEAKLHVEGVMVHKRHLKAGANQNLPNGGIVERPSKINISNVKFYSEKLGMPVRVGFEKNDGGEWIRVARGSKGNGAELD